MTADPSNLPGAVVLLTQARARVLVALEAEPDSRGLGEVAGLLAQARVYLAHALTHDEAAAGAHPQGPFVVLPQLTADEAAKVHEALNYVIITERVDPEGVLAELNPLRTAFAEATANRPELVGGPVTEAEAILSDQERLGAEARATFFDPKWAEEAKADFLAQAEEILRGGEIQTTLVKLEAPWTPDQVSALNRYQHAGSFHPFTCGRCRDELGTGLGPDSPQGPFDDRLLVATLTGWICPTCDYTQGWCWAFMAEASR